MKNLLSLTIMVSTLLTIHAEDKFYYSGDKKITLKEEAGKEVVILPASTSDNLPSTILSKSPEAQSDKVKVYRASSKEVAELKLQKNLTTPVIIEKTYTDPQGLEVAPTGYFNVCLKKAEDYDILEKRAAEFGLQITQQDKFMPLWYELVVTFQNLNSVIDIANQLSETGDFRACSPAFYFEPFEISYDPDVYKKWELFNPNYEGIDINVVPAWDYATGKGVKIAIVDTGVDLNHQDLSENIYATYDCVTGQSPSKYYGSHGTHVAGIAAAIRNNGIQVAGVAPEAKLMIASWDEENGNATSHIAAGINWAWMNGADIISCSWTTPEDQEIKSAIDNALAYGRGGKGCIIVKSAGNTGGSVTFPGNYRDEIITVGALGIDGEIAEFSSHGKSLFVTAPGVNVLSTLPDNQIGKKSGTSMACPHVSGLIALILERNEDLLISDIKSIVGRSARKIGEKPYDKWRAYGFWNEYYGFGLIDAYRAILRTPKKK